MQWLPAWPVELRQTAGKLAGSLSSMVEHVRRLHGHASADFLAPARPRRLARSRRRVPLCQIAWLLIDRPPAL